MQDALVAGKARLDVAAVRDQQVAAAVGCSEYGADRGQRKIELAQPADPAGRLQLVRRVPAVPGRRVGPGRREQAERVVVPQRLHGEPGQAGEPADRQQGRAAVGERAGGAMSGLEVHVRDRRTSRRGSC
jgi:hypothetical protein